MKWDELSQQQCSVARSLAVVGDRWTLLVLCDCFLGVRRFEEFRERLGLSRTTLTERLNLLELEGVLSKIPYQEKPSRYEYRLTEKGRDLYPIIISLMHWGDNYYPDAAGPPIIHSHQNCGQDFTPVIACSECNEELDPRETVARVRKTKGRSSPVPRGPMVRQSLGS